MTRQMKILLAVFVVLLLAIVANLTWIQVFGASKIGGNAFNKRRVVEEYAIQRGDILTSDGQVAAKSVDTGQEYRYQREYPMGKLFSDVTGYDSYLYGRTGIEKQYNNDLLGKDTNLSFRSLGNKLLGTSKKGNSVVMSVDSALQRVATEALGDQAGAVVALDPRTGRVLAMVTSPTYDANAAVPLPGGKTKDAWAAINADPGKPLLDRATSGLYPPGSSFKVVTASAALDSGAVQPDSQFDCTGTYHIPQFGNASIPDFSTRGHGRINLVQALVVSCNVTFAQVGIRTGAQVLVSYAERYGFNRIIPFDLPVARSSIQNAGSMDLLALASSAIGQAQDLATPLQMALVAGGVANGGMVMKPYVVQAIQDYNGKIVQKVSPSEWGRAISPQTATTLTDMMVKAVNEGTGTAAQIDGVQVAGKTGTAETGVPDAPAHAWFISFAPANNPSIAVAVIVEHGGGGGSVAAPIARQVMEAALGK